MLAKYLSTCTPKTPRFFKTIAFDQAKRFCLLQITAFFILFTGAQNSLGAEPPLEAALPHVEKIINGEDDINLYCLKKSYPQIKGLVEDSLGDKWLELAKGGRVLYASKYPATDIKSLNVDVRDSMAQPYPLEPMRPATPEGVAPGRKRPYALFEAIYGDSPTTVHAGLKPVLLLGKSMGLSENVANAFERAVPDLEKYGREHPKQRAFLKSDGGYCWRKIAGENHMSAHSYGIAFDIGADKAPYWRWSKLPTHPMQATYPTEIVQALEKRGFIWGGKWHEYDLMHFEYRPEIICKARIKAGLDKMPTKSEAK